MTIGDSLGPEGARPALRGIGGWLAFLCISLIVLTPLGMLREIFSLLRQPSAGNIFAISIDVALACFSIFAGMSLVKMYRHALRVAKIYLFIMLALGLLGTLSLFAADTTPEDSINAIRTAVVSFAWLLYLYRSERVRVTYAQTAVENVSEVFR